MQIMSNYTTVKQTICYMLHRIKQQYFIINDVPVTSREITSKFQTHLVWHGKTKAQEDKLIRFLLTIGEE